MDEKISQLIREGYWISIISLVVLWSIYAIIFSSVTQGNSLFDMKANENPPDMMPLSILFIILTFLIIILMSWITKKRIQKHKNNL